VNYRNRKLIRTIRIFFGVFMLMSGASGLIMVLSDMMPKDAPPEQMASLKMLWTTGIFQMIKVTEIVAGLMLIFGVLPQLAVLFLAPVGVGIVVVNARIAPPGVIMGLLVCGFLAYLTYAYWDCYRALFRRPTPAAEPAVRGFEVTDPRPVVAA
jgi:uncharacterized membrane protein YphA (DoxX/SURF4 family)